MSHVGRSLSERLARVFYEFCAVAGAAQLAASVLSAASLVPLRGAYAVFFRALVFRFGLVAPVGVGAVIALAAGLRARHGDLEPGRRFASSPYVVRGLCVSVSLSFLATEIGKLAHRDEMRNFFVSSGYPAWFLYAVIVAETIGAVGLLVPTVRSVAALGLSAIMAGAIFTHARNGDPFSDSWEAVHLLVILICIVALGILRDRLDRHPSALRARDPSLRSG